MGTQRTVSIFSGIAAIAALMGTGCGGANLAPDCEGFIGQYGAPGSDPILLANRVIKVYALSNCDGAGVNANCREVLVDTVLTGNDGRFRVDGLTNGDYRVYTFSVDGTTLINTDRVRLPDVCRATPTPSPTPTPG
ncbi:MAG: hypothetical protein V4671_03840 [Armatimonadota bacterium]